MNNFPLFVFIFSVTEDCLQMPINEIEPEVSIGTEIPDVEHTDEFQNQEILPPYTSIDDDHSTSFGKPQTREKIAVIEPQSTAMRFALF